MFTYKPIQLYIAFVVFFGINFSTEYVYAAIDDIDVTWDDIEDYIAHGKLKKVIPLLQELLTIEEERVFALETLALTYLKLGDDDAAIKSFEQLITSPEVEHYANTLVNLYYNQRQFNKIIDLYEERELLSWDESARELIDSSYLAAELFESTPNLISAADSKNDGKFSYLLGINVFTTRYPAFSDNDDIEDIEYTTETYLKTTLPITSHTFLTSRLSVSDERSNKNPASIANYRLQTYRAAFELKTRFERNLDLKIGAGTFFTDSGEPDTFNDIDLGSKWSLSGAVTKNSGPWTVIFGGVRDFFGDPGRETYELETITSGYTRTRLKLSKAFDAEANYWDRRFTGDTEDYQQLDGLLRYYPARFKSFSVNLGGEHEFRDRDENILKTGIEWIGVSGGSNQFFITTQFEANFDSGERELEVAGFFIRAKNDRTVNIGLVVNRELKLDDRTDVFIVLSFGNRKR